MFFVKVVFLHYFLAFVKIKKCYADLDWWQTCAIYEVYPKSFKDTNGDGIGDLKGIEQQVNYFTETGIEVIWLTSIFESSRIDGGYDIVDYKKIDPIFGRMTDFESLLATLKSKNIKLLLDFVPNHTSDECDWFEKSIKKIPPYTDYYVWRDPKNWQNNGTIPIPPNNWVSKFQGSAWKYNAERKQFYLHQYAKKQPDLNYRCPDVTKEMKNVIRFWLDKGVDGFRTDAAAYIMEAENFPDEPVLSEHKINSFPAYDSLDHIFTKHLPETLEILAQFREVVDEYKQKDGYTRILITEGEEETAKYYRTSNRSVVHFPINFQLANANGSWNASTFVSTINTCMNSLASGETINWVLGSHDTRRIASKFDKELVDALNTIVLLLPGVALTYYGEELGMEDADISREQTIDIKALNVGPQLYRTTSRDPARTPFQWTSGLNAGFSDYLMKTWLTINSNYKEVNFKKQRLKESSHWMVYRKLLKLRKNPAFREGELKTFVLTDWAFAFTRFIPAEEIYVVVVNLKNEATTLDLKSKIQNLPAILRVEVCSINSEYTPMMEIAQKRYNKFDMKPHSAVVLLGLSVRQKTYSKLMKIADLRRTFCDPTIAFVLTSVVCLYILYVRLLIMGKKTWLRRIKVTVRRVVKSVVNYGKSDHGKNTGTRSIEESHSLIIN